MPTPASPQTTARSLYGTDLLGLLRLGSDALRRALPKLDQRAQFAAVVRLLDGQGREGADRDLLAHAGSSLTIAATDLLLAQQRSAGRAQAVRREVVDAEVGRQHLLLCSC